MAHRRPRSSPSPPLTLAASPDAQAQAVERARRHRQAHRRARRRTPSCSIDALDGLGPAAARRALAAARAIADGGSLTIVAASTQPVGGETTVIALDRGAHLRPGASRRSTSPRAARCAPSCSSATPGAEAIAKARAEALGYGRGSGQRWE